MNTATSGSPTAAGGLRVELDRGACVASRYCVSRLPGVFKVEDGCATLLDQTPPPELRDALVQAARECPSGAIRVVDEGPL